MDGGVYDVGYGYLTELVYFHQSNSSRCWHCQGVDTGGRADEQCLEALTRPLMRIRMLVKYAYTDKEISLHEACEDIIGIVLGGVLIQECQGFFSCHNICWVPSIEQCSHTVHGD
jgi:hypothetical protein